MQVRQLVAETFERIVIYHCGITPEAAIRHIDLVLMAKGGERAESLHVRVSPSQREKVARNGGGQWVRQPKPPAPTGGRFLRTRPNQFLSRPPVFRVAGRRLVSPQTPRKGQLSMGIG